MSRPGAPSESTAGTEHVLDELFLIRLRYSERGLVEARRDRPFVLADPNLAWVVYSGSVDVFAVQVDGGQPCGPRQHLFRVEAGGALFGMDLSSRDTGLLLVGGPGAKLVKVSQARLREMLAKDLDKDALAGLVEDWVTRLSRAVIATLPAQDCLSLQASEAVRLAAGASTGPKKQVLWVRQRTEPAAGQAEACAGRLGFCHLPPLSQAQARHYLPLCKHTWVQAGQDLCLEVVDTVQWLAQDSTWNGLNTFHDLAAGCLSANRARAEQAESQRQRLKTEKSRLAMADALQGMAAILEGAPPHPPHGAGALDALLVACQAVCQPQGIRLRAPSRVQVERQKSNLLEAIARVSGVRTRQVYLAEGWWKKDYGPLLGFLDAKGQPRHPVALLPGKGGYRMFDPQSGETVPVTAPATAALGELATMFYRPFPEHPLTIWELVRFGLYGCRVELGFMLGMAGLSSLLALFGPLATGWLFSRVIPNTDSKLLGFLALGWACNAIAGALVQMTGGLAQLRLESRLELALESAIWSRLMSLPATFFRGYSAGDLASRAFSISAMRRLLTGATLAALLNSLFSVFSLALLFYYDAGLALAAVGLAAVALAVTYLVTSRQLHNLRAEMRLEGRLGALVLQLLNGISKLRVAGAEEWAFSLWANRFSEKKQAAYQARLAGASLAVFNAAFSTLTTLLFFALVAGRAAHMPAATYLAFSAAFGQFQASLLSLGLLFNSLQTLRLQFERTRPILEAVPEVETSQADPGVLSGRIEISHVSYRYSEDTPLVLNDLSLTVEPGEFVAIVGPSGSGKSTLVRLLLKFETPRSGAVYYDGQDLAGLNAEAVRRQVGVVLQSGRLMPGSIFSNIVGALPLSLDEAWEAARMAGLDQYIASLPMGMQTVVSEGGSTFSGGQRQRLMIARAIVARPRILLFDEATSALDSESQASVSKNLENLQATRIVIAHRLSTIAQADHLYVLDQGSIRQSGTYDELMRRPGPFAELVKRQL